MWLVRTYKFEMLIQDFPYMRGWNGEYFFKCCGICYRSSYTAYSPSYCSKRILRRVSQGVKWINASTKAFRRHIVWYISFTPVEFLHEHFGECGWYTFLWSFRWEIAFPRRKAAYCGCLGSNSNPLTHRWILLAVLHQTHEYEWRH